MMRGVFGQERARFWRGSLLGLCVKRIARGISVDGCVVRNGGPNLLLKCCGIDLRSLRHHLGQCFEGVGVFYRDVKAHAVGLLCGLALLAQFYGDLAGFVGMGKPPGE